MLAGASLEGAIAATVAYADVFAFAPSAAEIHRHLLGWRAARAEIERALGESRDLASVLGQEGGLYFLARKQHLAPRRRRFQKHGELLWPQAQRIARVVEASGLARAGLVTGSLAADNADEHADIDFLFIYPAERVWTSFALVRALGHTPALAKMCPNYALPEDRLEVHPQNLFTALEIAKAVPMFGLPTYRRFIRANAWVERYLPNALPQLAAPDDAAGDPAPPLARMLDRLPLGPLESLERRRKFGAELRDVGVDMQARERQGSVDRHSPTRSFHALSELRYRLEELGLCEHPLYPELAGSTATLSAEMGRWGSQELAGRVERA